MESPLTRAHHEVIGDDDLLVHEWRVTQLTRLGVPSYPGADLMENVMLRSLCQAGGP
jgi:hypothetical protein